LIPADELVAQRKYQFVYIFTPPPIKCAPGSQRLSDRRGRPLFPGKTGLKTGKTVVDVVGIGAGRLQMQGKCRAPLLRPVRNDCK
jgi:hypothetical protein